MRFLSNIYIKILFGVIGAGFFLIAGQAVHAAPAPAITLTFDDASVSQYEYAAPILKTAGQKATLYVPTGLVGTEGYMTWQNIVDMVNDGWEMGGHSVTHAELPLLTPEQIEQEVKDNFAILEAHGLLPVDFASPFGAYDPAIIATIASYFTSHRGYHEIGFNAWPYNSYLLYVQQITNQTTPEQVDAWIQEAITNKYWLIIVFHEILPTVEQDNTYGWTTVNLETLMTTLATYGVKTKTVAEVLNMKNSLFPNTDFASGIADGWTTDTPEQVVADLASHGAVPTPASSIKIIGGALPAYLASPAALVTNTKEYGIRVFTNAINLTSGEFGFYVDEYNADNQWVSWKFLGAATAGNVIDEAYPYQPTSEAVTSVQLRMSLAAGAVGYVYVDNASFFEMGEGDPLPVPQPVVIPPLPLPNTDFASGLAQGWNTNNATQVTFDTTGKGAAPTIDSTIKMTGGSLVAHLFSPKALMDPAGTYNVSAFIDASALTSGEIGLYIDEYDANENWISGKWLGLAPLGSKGNLSFQYTPTSAQVASVSLQVYLIANSTGEAFVDNAEINVATPPPAPAALPLPNTDFASGLAQGWNTTNATQVTFDATGKGAVPTADSTIKMTGGSLVAHLFSPKALLDATTTYDVSAFIDASGLTAGEIGLYIDEYDTNKNWISGKWLGLASLGTKGNLSFQYTPTSTQVVSASLQVYLIANSTGEAFVDNAEINVATPPPAPAVLPLPNTDFAQGLAQGWNTNNPTQVIFDTTGKGAAPTIDSTIKMAGGSLAAHLFSPKALMDPLGTYNVSALIDATGLTTGEIGLYIDEYDANENWISGKWLGLAPLATKGNLSFQYTPTSTQVVSASLQVYLIANSTGEAFVDNAEIKIP